MPLVPLYQPQILPSLVFPFGRSMRADCHARALEQGSTKDGCQICAADHASNSICLSFQSNPSPAGGLWRAAVPAYRVLGSCRGVRDLQVPARGAVPWCVRGRVLYLCLRGIPVWRVGKPIACRPTAGPPRSFPQAGPGREQHGALLRTEWRGSRVRRRPEDRSARLGVWITLLEGIAFVHDGGGVWSGCRVLYYRTVAPETILATHTISLVCGSSSRHYESCELPNAPTSRFFVFLEGRAI